LLLPELTGTDALIKAVAPGVELFCPLAIQYLSCATIFIGRLIDRKNYLIVIEIEHQMI
jgi:hypothetical protein